MNDEPFFLTKRNTLLWRMISFGESDVGRNRVHSTVAIAIVSECFFSRFSLKSVRQYPLILLFSFDRTIDSENLIQLDLFAILRIFPRYSTDLYDQHNLPLHAYSACLTLLASGANYIKTARKRKSAAHVRIM